MTKFSCNSPQRQHSQHSAATVDVAFYAPPNSQHRFRVFLQEVDTLGDNRCLNTALFSTTLYAPRRTGAQELFGSTHILRDKCRVERPASRQFRHKSHRKDSIGPRQQRNMKVTSFGYSRTSWVHHHNNSPIFLALINEWWKVRVRCSGVSAPYKENLCRRDCEWICRVHAGENLPPRFTKCESTDGVFNVWTSEPSE